MNRLLPSEIARLVLGYLKTVGCVKTLEFYLLENRDLAVYVSCMRSGYVFPTSINHKSLLDILNDYDLFKTGNDRSQTNLTKSTRDHGVQTDEVVTENFDLNYVSSCSKGTEIGHSRDQYTQASGDNVFERCIQTDHESDVTNQRSELVDQASFGTPTTEWRITDNRVKNSFGNPSICLAKSKPPDYSHSTPVHPITSTPCSNQRYIIVTTSLDQCAKLDNLNGLQVKDHRESHLVKGQPESSVEICDINTNELYVNRTVDKLAESRSKKRKIDPDYYVGNPIGGVNFLDSLVSSDKELCERPSKHSSSDVKNKDSVQSTGLAPSEVCSNLTQDCSNESVTGRSSPRHWKIGGSSKKLAAKPQQQIKFPGYVSKKLPKIKAPTRKPAIQRSCFGEPKQLLVNSILDISTVRLPPTKTKCKLPRKNKTDSATCTSTVTIKPFCGNTSQQTAVTTVSNPANLVKNCSDVLRRLQLQHLPASRTVQGACDGDEFKAPEIQVG